MSSTPLTELSVPQIDLILEKLHLYAPSNYDGEDRLNLLSCSMIFARKFGGLDCSDVLAKYNRGKFIDLESTNGEVCGLFTSSDGSNNLLYPCVMCTGDVTDKNDNTGYGLHCSSCEHYFHNSCCDNPLSEQLYNSLKDSPKFV